MTPCTHHRGRPCPIPGCSVGVEGARLVVCGIGGPRYFERGFVQVGEELRIGWVEVETFGPQPNGFEDAMRYAMEVACQA